MIDRDTGFAAIAAVAWVAAATVVALLLQRLPHANLSLVYLLAVLVVAARQGFWPSVLASLLSFIVYNFLFTPPYYTLAVREQGDIATLVFFLAVAAITGNLAARMRGEMTRTRAAVAHTSRLLAFSRRLAASASVEAATKALVESVAQALHCTALAWTPGADGRLELRATAGPGTSAPDAGELERAWRAPAAPVQVLRWRYLQIGASAGRLGLLGIDLETVRAEDEELLAGLCDQTAVAMERVTLASDLDAARLASETERFRAALLSSVSHDLRTPLATIVGALTSLQELWPSLGADAREELLRTAIDESNRLDRYIQNLLDMTRLGHGTTVLRREWVDLNDVVANAIRRLDTVLDKVRLEFDIAPDAALAHVHGAFLEQVLVNLLDNAARFSPAGGRVTLEARRGDEGIVIDVADEGPGIPDEERERVFEMFYRSKGRERSDQGSGLGLAICRGLVGAHGGDIRAVTTGRGSGACIRVILPTAAQPGEPPTAVERGA